MEGIIVILFNSAPPVCIHDTHRESEIKDNARQNAKQLRTSCETKYFFFLHKAEITVCVFFCLENSRVR